MEVSGIVDLFLLSEDFSLDSSAMLVTLTLSGKTRPGDLTNVRLLCPKTSVQFPDEKDTGIAGQKYP